MVHEEQRKYLFHAPMYDRVQKPKNITDSDCVFHRSNCYVSNDFTKHVFQDYLEHLQFPPPIPKHYPGPFDNAGRRAILLQFKYCNFFSLLSRVLFILFQLSMQRNRRYIGKAIIPLLTFDDIDSIEFYPYIIYQGNPKISHCS